MSTKIVTSLFFPILVAGLLAALPVLPVAAKDKSQDQGPPAPKNEIQAKLAAGYVALPRVTAPVHDADGHYRAVDVEIWVSAKTPEGSQALRGCGKQVVAVLKTRLDAYPWESYNDPEQGLDIIKKETADGIKAKCAAEADDIYIKSMVAR